MLPLAIVKLGFEPFDVYHLGYEELFEHYMTAQLVRVSINGDTQMLGQPGIVAGYDSSPDGRFVLAELRGSEIVEAGVAP